MERHMSVALAILPEETEEVAKAHESPPLAPRSRPTAATLAFLVLVPGSGIVAYIACFLTLYMVTHSRTLGAWTLVIAVSLWAFTGISAVLASNARGEWP